MIAWGQTIIRGWSGVFTVRRASESNECGRFMAKLAPVLSFSVSPL